MKYQTRDVRLAIKKVMKLLLTSSSTHMESSIFGPLLPTLVKSTISM